VNLAIAVRSRPCVHAKLEQPRDALAPIAQQATIAPPAGWIEAEMKPDTAPKARHFMVSTLVILSPREIGASLDGWRRAVEEAGPRWFAAAGGR